MIYKTEIKSRQILNKPFWIMRVSIKLLLRKLGIRKVSFCKCCGIDVRDFNAPDDKWKNVSEFTGNKNILCYNCYCDFEYLSRNQ